MSRKNELEGNIMEKDDWTLPIDGLFDFDGDGDLDAFERSIETGVIMDEFDDKEFDDEFEDDEFDDEFDDYEFDDF